MERKGGNTMQSKALIKHKYFFISIITLQLLLIGFIAYSLFWAVPKIASMLKEVQWPIKAMHLLAQWALMDTSTNLFKLVVFSLAILFMSVTIYFLKRTKYTLKSYFCWLGASILFYGTLIEIIGVAVYFIM